MKIGDEIYIHGYVDEIRKDVVIIRNEGGYFGTIPNEIIRKSEVKTLDKWVKDYLKTEPREYPCNTCANKGDHDGECSNCIADSEQIRWKTPSHYKPKDESQIKCPKCGRYDYIRSFEDWDIDDSIYKYKCINCNTYIKDEPQTEDAYAYDEDDWYDKTERENE